MMTWFIVGYVLFLVFVLALCKAAARGDEQSERYAAMKRHPSYKERKS
jgi:hypothetical protein